MKSYTFPFNTCEKNQKNVIAQPYSTFINLTTSIIIFYFLLQVKDFKTCLLFVSFLLFELFHTFSHCVHIPGSIQVNVTHMLSYFINFSLLYFFYKTSTIFPGKVFLLFYLIVIIIDIYSLFNLELIYYLFTQALLFLSILFYYKNQIPKNLINNVYYMVVLVVLIIIALINEMYNCNYLLEKYPNIPFHSIIEILGCILFFIMCSTFLQIK